MKNSVTIKFLVWSIAILATVTTCFGIFSQGGPGPYLFKSIHGTAVMIYGKGLYQHMSAEVAPQGIAQDWVTLCLAVPILLFSYAWARSGSLRGRLLLTGVLGYFLLTYLFYLAMGMYNEMFLGYVCLLSASFFALAYCLYGLKPATFAASLKTTTLLTSYAVLLLIICAAIALLWLSIVVPPLLNGTIYPVQVEHYTTLIVQGLDLAIFLPLAAVSAILSLQKKALGYLLLSVYYIFLSLLMTALSAKVVAMAMLGYNVIPAVFIIPAFNLLCLGCSISILSNICENKPQIQHPVQYPSPTSETIGQA